MANVDVRVQNGVKEHRHPGYPEHGKPQWHPVSQKHDTNLHEKYGISGKEKPNRESPEDMAGVRRPKKEDLKPDKRKPKESKPKKDDTKEKNAVAGAVEDIAGKWNAKFKALAHKPPSNKWAKLLYDATMPVVRFAETIQDKMKEEDAKASLRGFDEAMEKFDEITAFSDAKRMSQMSLADLKRLDRDMVKIFNEKYHEYGGAELKGKKDRESLQRKAELRAYRDIINNMRETADAKAEEMKAEAERAKGSETRTRTNSRTNTTSEGRKKPSARDLRQRKRSKESKPKETTE